MNRIPTGWPTTNADGDAAPVVLAHEAPFALGPLRIEPGMRRIVRADGQDAIVEPLVMQVLVALAKADGAILTRDELVDRCWGGRIVGDDSIARVIGRLRKLGAEFGEGAFAVETITKVGYRLAGGDSAKEQAANPVVPAGAKSKFSGPRIAILAAVAGTMIAAGGGVAAFVANREPAEITIGVEPVISDGRDRVGQAFASDLTSDLTRLAGAVDRINLVDRGLPGGERPDLLVRVSVARDGPSLYAQARLVDVGNGSMLWSRTYRSDDGSAARLREKAAVGLAGLIRCGMDRSATKYDDPTSMRLYLAACDAVEQGDWVRADSFNRQIVARRPDVAAGWACLAATTLLMAESQASTPAQVEAARRRAIGYARRAIQLDPRSGRGYKALAIANDASGPETLAVLERGIRADPESPELYGVYATTLFNAGYVRAGVPPILRAIALNPVSRFTHDVAVRRLLAAGRTAEAFAMQARVERTWPDHPDTATQGLRLLPYYRDPAAAVAELERLASAADEAVELPPLLRAEVRWRADPASLDRAQLDREADAAYREGAQVAWVIAAIMNRMGERERAFAWLARAPRREAHSQWSVLFWPDAAPLRRDPRFFAAMAELGLVDLWVKRGQWPDFCSEPGLRYDCRTEAARLGKLTTA